MPEPESPESFRVAASHTLELEEDCPTDTVAFHAQQCVEKYLKALLVVDGIDFPRTHSLSVLLDLVEESKRPALTTEEQERLTDYATTTRYPGEYEAI
jgi:HEPN domain-containing protein